MVDLLIDCKKGFANLWYKWWNGYCVNTGYRKTGKTFSQSESRTRKNCFIHIS